MIYKLVTRVIQYFCFYDRPMKGGDILDFQKRVGGWGGGGGGGGGGVDLENMYIGEDWEFIVHVFYWCIP